MSTHDSAKDTPRHPTSVAPGEAAGDGLDEPLEEGLGERLEWLVDFAHDLDDDEDLHQWWCHLSDDEQWIVVFCAIRELDGQRHALREERKALLSSWWRAMEAAGIQVHESLPDAVRGMRDERDAALAEVERERDRLDDCARRGLSVCRDIDDARSERDAAIERAERAEAMVRELEAEVVAWQGFFEQERPGLVDVTPHIDGAGRHAYDGPEPGDVVRRRKEHEFATGSVVEPFDAWHARECPWVVKLYPKEARRGWRGSPCLGEMVFSMGQKSVAPERFKGRTCRAVYAAEVLGLGGEEGAAE